jgi:hypothetical protein
VKMRPLAAFEKAWFNIAEQVDKQVKQRLAPVVNVMRKYGLAQDERTPEAIYVTLDRVLADWRKAGVDASYSESGREATRTILFQACRDLALPYHQTKDSAAEVAERVTNRARATDRQRQRVIVEIHAALTEFKVEAPNIPGVEQYVRRLIEFAREKTIAHARLYADQQVYDRWNQEIVNALAEFKVPQPETDDWSGWVTRLVAHMRTQGEDGDAAMEYKLRWERASAALERVVNAVGGNYALFYKVHPVNRVYTEMADVIIRQYDARKEERDAFAKERTDNTRFMQDFNAHLNRLAQIAQFYKVDYTIEQGQFAPAVILDALAKYHMDVRNAYFNACHAAIEEIFYRLRHVNVEPASENLPRETWDRLKARVKQVCDVLAQKHVQVNTLTQRLNVIRTAITPED